MTQSETHQELVGHFVATARAHHEATGGAKAQWAEWYADRLIDGVNSVMSTELTTQELVEWLEKADRRYLSEDQDESWPKVYASWLLEDLGESVAGDTGRSTDF